MKSKQNFRIHSVLVLSIFIFLFTLASCESKMKGYRLKGKINDIDTGQLYLTYDTASSINSIALPFDTAVLKGGNFEFTGTVPHPMPCVLTFPDGTSVAYMILENSELTLDTGTNQFGRIVRGSLSQSEAEGLGSLWEAYAESQNSRLDSLADLPNISEKMRDSLRTESRKIDSVAEAAYNQKVLEYVKSHSSSYGVLYGWRVEELWAEGSTAPARRIFEQFDPALRSSPQGKFHERSLRYYESMQAGQPAPELNLKDADGNFVKLSTYKGKRIIFLTQSYGAVSDEYYQALNKLTNTVFISSQTQTEPLSKLKYLTVYQVDGIDSPYLPFSEMAPWAFVIDENGKILSKGYEPWNDLK